MTLALVWILSIHLVANTSNNFNLLEAKLGLKKTNRLILKMKVKK
jgi:hypothetical protein